LARVPAFGRSAVEKYSVIEARAVDSLAALTERDSLEGWR
jgi:hypothetical protein